ncbi:hypothetical protein RI054_18g83820 [Pseudoscourfieldia marina]
MRIASAWLRSTSCSFSRYGPSNEAGSWRALSSMSGIVFFPWKRTSNSWLANISGPSSHLTPEKSAVHRQVVPSVAPWQPAPQRLAEDDAPALNAGMFTCVPSSSSVNDACLCVASCFVE